MNEAINLANIIASQIGARRLMAHGATKLMALPETDSHAGGLIYTFNNCPKIKEGVVTVQLRWDDTYDVTIKDKSGKDLQVMNEVYCDQFHCIDEVIG